MRIRVIICRLSHRGRRLGLVIGFRGKSWVDYAFFYLVWFDFEILQQIHFVCRARFWLGVHDTAIGM